MNNLLSLGTGICEKQLDDGSIQSGPITNTVVTTLTTAAEFDALHADWLRLHIHSESAGLFNSWYWNRQWWRHYGEAGQLFIVAVKINNIVQGIAPFYRCNTRLIKRIQVRTLHFIGSGGDTSPDDLDILYAKDYEDDVIESICHFILHSSACARLQLTDLVQDSAFVKKLLESSHRNRWGRPQQRHQHRRVDALPASIDALEKKLSRNARKQRKRRRQQLHKTGTHFQFKPCRTQADVNTAFSQLMHLHHLRHEGKGGSDSFVSEKYQRFHLAVMEKALQNDELRLTTLTIDDKPIGVEYAFLCKGTLSFFQTGFDPAYQHLSPGHLMMMETIDRAIDDGATRVDLLKGDYTYKQTYAKQIKTTVNLDVWKNPFLAFVTAGLRRIFKANHLVKATTDA
ncbi:MAG: GNAT family N-acetyltransferase [Granulosicoccus sp.]